MRIVYIVSDGVTEYNSSQFRVSYIGDALMRAGHHVTILNIKQWLNQSPECRIACAKADIIHLQRVLVSDTHDMIRHWTSLGKAVVADWDDAYDKARPVWRRVKSAAHGRHHALAAAGKQVHALGGQPVAKLFGPPCVLLFARTHDTDDGKSHAHFSASFGFRCWAKIAMFSCPGVLSMISH